LRRAAAEVEPPHFGLPIPGAHGADTGLATGRHVRDHDEPMAFVHETGDDGAFELEKKDAMSEGLVDFDGEGV
ncbi:MAG: hypothetical protein Q9211_006466, partial [Gyalolechia sp. 1 TL-2023]